MHVAQGPTALLGDAVHRAMQLIVDGTAIDAAWAEACADMIEAGKIDPRALPAARRVRLRLERRASLVLELIDRVSPDQIALETRITTSDGALEGTPDIVLVKSNEVTVIDYKSGIVAGEDGLNVKYERQLQIYSGLAQEANSVAASRALLLSMKQGFVEVPTSAETISEALLQARAARDDYNDRVPGRQPARPSAQRCKYCPYAPVCDGFWDAVGPEWVADVGEAIRGTIEGAPESSANDLSAIRVRVDEGTFPAGETIQLAEIPAAQLGPVQSGDRVAVTGLQVRDDQRWIGRWREWSRLHRETSVSE
jgi:CRISPR/Cas system-associated exonuclease Cas4 (RecB family)